MRGFRTVCAAVLLLIAALITLVALALLGSAEARAEGGTGFSVLGFLFVGVLVFISVLLLREPRPRPTLQPTENLAAAEERPPVAQARLDEAEQAVIKSDYGDAFGLMHAENWEALRRRDSQALRQLLELADRIETAPDASPRIKKQARSLARTVAESLAYLEQAAAPV